jgi:hypothetical protein
MQKDLVSGRTSVATTKNTLDKSLPNVAIWNTGLFISRNWSTQPRRLEKPTMSAYAIRRPASMKMKTAIPEPERAWRSKASETVEFALEPYSLVGLRKLRLAIPLRKPAWTPGGDSLKYGTF